MKKKWNLDLHFFKFIIFWNSSEAFHWMNENSTLLQNNDWHLGHRFHWIGMLSSVLCEFERSLISL